MLVGASALTAASLFSQVQAVLGKTQTGSVIKSGGKTDFGFKRALASHFRIGMYGTSIGASSIGTLQKFEENVRAVWGDAGSRVVHFGGIGGSYANVYLDSWNRQPYGGPTFIRLRGEAGATPITRIVYGDQIDYFHSQEEDSSPHTINVDGVDYSVGAAGLQRYGVRERIRVELAPHLVTINAPIGSGYAYPERLVARNTAAVGVEVEDYTYGGSSLRNTVTLQGVTGEQVPGVPVAGDTGIRSLFEVPDLDLAIFTFTVNDAGMDGGSPSGWVRSGQFAATLNKLLEGFRAQDVPVIYLIEMAGHYIMPNEAGSNGRFTAYNEVKEIIKSQAGDGVFVLDWDQATRDDSDIEKYAATYYPQVNALEYVNGSWTGDFIHPNQVAHRPADKLLGDLTGITIPNDSTADREFAARARTLPDAINVETAVLIEGAMQSLSPVGAAVQPLCETVRDASRIVPVFAAPAGMVGLTTELRQEIDKSTQADDFGRYVDLTNYLVKGTFLPNTDYWLVVHGSGQMQVRTNSDAIRAIVDGKELPFSDVANSRTNMAGPALVPGVDAPYSIAVQFRPTAPNQTMMLNGRIYAATVSQSDWPLMARSAPA